MNRKCALIFALTLVAAIAATRASASAQSRERPNAQRITPVVGPPMLAQVAVAGLLLLDGAAGGLELLNATLVAVVFGSTVAVYGPMHDGLEPGGVARLVRLNWVRTVVWSAQLVVAVALAA